MSDHFAGHVVDVDLEQPHRLTRPTQRTSGLSHNDLHHIGATVHVERTGTVPTTAHNEGRQRTERVGESSHECHARGCGQFTPIVEPSERNLTHGRQRHRGRRRIGQLSMLRAHCAMAGPDGSARQRVDAENFERGARAHDVDDRIDRPDLVELHVVHVDPVDLGLHLGQQREHCEGPITNALRQIGSFEERTNVAPGAVVVIVVLVHRHDGSRRPHTGSLRGFERQRIIVETQTAEHGSHRDRIGTSVDE